MNPKISILMGVYNAEKYLREAVQSVFCQTMRDWELIVVNDCSTDQSPQILGEFAQADARVRVFTNEKNLGLTKSLNRGLKECMGKYIARLDADDIAEPARLEKQLVFMEAHPEVALCGSQGTVIDDVGNKIGNKNFPTDYAAIKDCLIFNNQFIHSALFIRADILKSGGGYNESFSKSQDYELVLRLSASHPVANLPDRLINWRMRKQSISWTDKRQEKDALRARWWGLVKYGYPKTKGISSILVRLFWMILPLRLKWKRYENKFRNSHG